MTLSVFLGLSVAVQLLFLGLDLADRHATRGERNHGEPLRLASIVFLLTIVIVFLVIQLAGLALVPRADALVDSVRQLVVPGSGAVTAPKGWRLAVLSIVVFYLAGLVDYAWHRWFSHNHLFWFTHESHHLPSEIFVGMPGLGVRPFAVVTVVPLMAFTAALTYGVLRVAGGPMWGWTIFQIPLLVASTLLVTSHSSFMRRGWLAHRVLTRLTLTSPQEHVLHHTVDLRGNYGNFTTVWDRLFGTYLDPRLPENSGHRFGLPYDRDFLGAITGGMIELPPSWRDRFQLARYCNIDRSPTRLDPVEADKSMALATHRQRAKTDGFGEIKTTPIPVPQAQLASVRQLVTRTLPVAVLDTMTRNAAFALFEAAYENTSRARFERDLAEKQHIILLYDRATQVLKGFSTVLVREISSAGRKATVVFSGDTVIDRNYWGQKHLQLAFARLLVTLKMRAPWRPLYWFLLSKGYRTYLLLANAFPRAFPRVDRREDHRLRAILDELAAERFGDQYDRARGVVRYRTLHERVREGVAPVTAGALQNAHVRFFVERNTQHADGTELACLADVRLMDLARVLARIAKVKVARRSVR